MSVTTGSGITVPPIVDYGVGSGGLNTQAIIQAELQTYVTPETRLQTQQTSIASNVSDYQQINTDLLALQTQAQTMATPAGWDAKQSTSSNTAVATATAADGTPSGSVQFAVTQLATSGSLISAGSVASASQIVTSAPSIMVAQGTSQLGFASLGDGSSLTLGGHTVAVTQASEAASTTGTIALGAQTSGISMAAGSNTVDVTADGTAYSLAVAPAPAGGYSASGLLSAVQTAISAAGAGSVMQAGYDSSGHLVLSTADQGSSQSLQVTGGSALSTLGLSAMTTASTGVDGVVQLDGTATTLSDVQPGAAVTLNGPNGTSLTATLAASSSLAQVNSSLLATGSLTATSVSTGNGSLTAVVANINAANTGVVASAVETGNNQYIMQLSSAVTGTDSGVSVSPGAFAGSSLGALNVASAGSNAEIQIGGAGGYTLQSQTDTFAGLLPGLSIAVQAVSTTPVTVSVSPDTSSIAGQIQTLVTDANTALSDVQNYAGYNAASKTAGPLMGSAMLQTVTNQIQSIFASVAGTSGLGSAANVGVTLSGGQVAFNQTAFETAFSANPSAVASMFTQGSTFAAAQPAYSGQLSLSYASNTTQSGSYDVVVNQSASQATDAGAVLSTGAVSSAEQLTVSSGTSSIPYTTTAGQSLTSIASGLNQAFAAAGVQLSAQLTNNGQQLQLISDDYGSATSFSVATTGGGAGSTGLAGTFTGTDVAGTINGQAATGIGQFLSASPSAPVLAGLSIQVTTPGITSATDLGQFSYVPGIAQSLSTLSTAMADPTKGSITQTIKGLQTQSLGLNSQIAMYAGIVTQEQTLLTNQYAKLDATLSSLTNQGTTLTAELAQLAANSSAS